MVLAVFSKVVWEARGHELADLGAPDQAGAKKRRSTRIVQAIPISVSGTDALGQPFKERTSTVMVNCHGCKYQSKHYVPKYSLVVLEIPRSDASTPHIVSARVIWVQRPRTLRELFQIGVEFDASGNVWGIAFPPEDWGVEPAKQSGGAGGPQNAPPPAQAGARETRLEVVPPPTASPSGNAGPAPLATPGGTRDASAYMPFSGRPYMADASIGGSSSGKGFTGASSIEQRGKSVIPLPVAPDGPAKSPENSESTNKAGDGASGAAGGATRSSASESHAYMAEDLKGSQGGAPQGPREGEAAQGRPLGQHTPPVVVPGEVAKEIDRLVSEARYSLHQVARHEGRAAVIEEMEATRAKVDAHLKEAVEQALASSVSRVSEQALQMVIQDSAFKAAAIIQDVRTATQNTAAELEAQLKQSLQAAMEESATRAAEQAVAQATEKRITQEFHRNVESALSDLLGSRPELPEALASDDAARARAEQIRKDIEEASERARVEQQAALERVSREAGERLQNEVQSALGEASRALNEQVTQVSQAAAKEAASAVEQSVQNSLEEASAKAREAAEAIRSGAAQDQARAAEQQAQFQQAAEEAARQARQAAELAASQTRQAAEAALDQTRKAADAAAEQTRQASEAALADTRRQIEEMGSARAAELAREADRLVSERAAHLEPALQESAKKIFSRLSNEAQQQLAPHVESAQRLAASLAQLRAETEQAQQALEQRLRETADATLQNSGEAMRRLANELTAAREQAEAPQRSLQQSLQEATEGALRGAHERFARQNEEYSAKLDATLRETIQKAEEQWTERSTAAQHSTFESLLKASDWYSKKAQTQMQASLEKAVENSGEAINQKAAEASRKVASELDHYSRSYVQHAQRQIDEAAGEIAARQQKGLRDVAEASTAALREDSHRMASNVLSEMQDAASESKRQIMLELSKSSEASLAQFQDALDKNVAKGLVNAGGALEAQLAPLMEAWKAQREEEKKAWMEQLKGTSDDSIEAYKARLENASNSWLLASATSLGRHSQAVIDALAATAEQRLRDTCAQILGNMGDAIRQRLMGLSTDLAPGPGTGVPGTERKEEERKE